MPNTETKNENHLKRTKALYFFTLRTPWFTDTTLGEDPRGVTQVDLNQLILKNFRAIWGMGDIVVLFTQQDDEKAFKENILARAGFTQEDISKLIIINTTLGFAQEDISELKGDSSLTEEIQQTLTQCVLLHLKSLVVKYPEVESIKYYDVIEKSIQVIDHKFRKLLERAGKELSLVKFVELYQGRDQRCYYDRFYNMFGNYAVNALRSMIPLSIKSLTPKHCYRTPSSDIFSSVFSFEPFEGRQSDGSLRIQLTLPFDPTFHCLKDRGFRLPEKHFKPFHLAEELQKICPQMEAGIETYHDGCSQLFIRNPRALQKLLEQKPNALEPIKKSWEEAIECGVALYEYIKKHPMVLEEYQDFTMDKVPAYLFEKQKRTSDYVEISERLINLLNALTSVGKVGVVNRFLADTIENMESLLPSITLNGLLLQCRLGILYCQQAKNYYLKTQDKQGTIALLNKTGLYLTGVSTFQDHCLVNHFEGFAAIHLGGVLLCLARFTHDVEQAANYRGKAREAFENALRKYPMFSNKSRQFVQDRLLELGGSNIVGVINDEKEDKENSVSKLELALKSIRDPDEFIGELIKDPLRSSLYNNPLDAHRTYLYRVMLHHPKGKEFIVAQLKERSNKDHTRELNECAQRIKMSLISSAINEAAKRFRDSIYGAMTGISRLEVFKKSKDEVLSMLSLTDEFKAVKKFLLLIDDKFQPRSYDGQVRERDWGTPKRFEFSTVRSSQEVIDFLETKLEGELQPYKNAFDKILLRELDEYCRFESLWEGREFKSDFIKYADKINSSLTWEDIEPLSLAPWSVTLSAGPVGFAELVSKTLSSEVLKSQGNSNVPAAPASELKDTPSTRLTKQ